MPTKFESFKIKSKFKVKNKEDENFISRILKDNDYDVDQYIKHIF